MTRHEDQRWADEIRERNRAAASLQHGRVVYVPRDHPPGATPDSSGKVDSEWAASVRARTDQRLAEMATLDDPRWTPRPKRDPAAIAFDIQHFKAVHGVSLPDHAHEWLQEMADRCWNLPSVWARVGLGVVVGTAIGYLLGLAVAHP